MAKVNSCAAGGTAGEGAKICKVTLPSSWSTRLGIDGEHHQVEMYFDGAKISLAPYLDFERFAAVKKSRTTCFIGCFL